MGNQSSIHDEILRSLDLQHPYCQTSETRAPLTLPELLSPNTIRALTPTFLLLLDGGCSVSTTNPVFLGTDSCV